MIHTEIVQEGYGARVSNLQMLDAISQDVMAAWVYPFTPNTNHVTGQSYQLFQNNVYREDDVHLANECHLSDAVIGKDTRIGTSSITSSFVGRNCKIGDNVQITNSFIWDDVTIDDNSVINHSIVAEFAVVGKNCNISAGCLLASGVHISDDIDLLPSTVLSLISAEEMSVPSDTNLLGPQGKGALFQDPDFDDLDENDPYRLQKSLIYSLDDYDINISEVSTLASDDDFDALSDDEEQSSHPTDKNGSRSHLDSFASFASDDSTRAFSNFLYDAINGLLDVLRGGSGDLDSEKLEFMSLRLANNASVSS
jgi:translation initiation factor eIF-2B subunit epsilon